RRPHVLSFPTRRSSDLLRNFSKFGFFFTAQLFFYNFGTKFNTLIAYINARPSYKFANLFLTFTAKRTFQLSFFFIKFKQYISPLNVCIGCLLSQLSRPTFQCHHTKLKTKNKI